MHIVICSRKFGKGSFGSEEQTHWKCCENVFSSRYGSKERELRKTTAKEIILAKTV